MENEKALASINAKLSAILGLLIKEHSATLFEDNRTLKIGFLEAFGLSDDEIAVLIGTNKNNVRVGRQYYKKITTKK